MAGKPGRRFWQGIAGKWLITSTGAVLITLLAAIAVVAMLGRQYYYGSVRQSLYSRSEYLAQMMEQYADGSIPDSFDVDLAHYIRTFPEAACTVMAFGGEGEPLISAGQLAEVPSLPDYDRAVSSPDGTGWWLGELEGGKVLSVCRLVPVEGSRFAAVRYIMGLSEADRAVWGLLWTTAGAGSLLLLGVLALGIIFTRGIVRPVREIGAAASRIAAGDFGTRVSRRAGDELGELCGTVNAMADALERSEKLKNEFISSVSHELRTPLTAIQGWAETLGDAAVDGEITPDEMELVNKGIRVIAEETARLSEMVEELLDFSRMENGRLKMEMERMDILAELEEAVLVYEERARKEGKSLSYTAPPMLPVLVGDRSRLRQVFLNLIDNAVKYTAPGGKIAVSAGLSGESVEIVISDDGAGIPPADLPHVKERFYKAAHSRPGSGIGLAVADEIVSRHGGTLSIRSSPGKGTAVSILLPIRVKGEPMGETGEGGVIRIE